MIDAGARTDVQDNQGHVPAYWAVRNGQDHLIALLSRANSMNMRDAMHIIREFRSKDIDMLEACRQGYLKYVQALLMVGVDVNEADESMAVTPLHTAVNYGQAEIADLLVNNGADVNKQDKFGWAPLHDAASLGYVALAARLLRAGARVDIKNVHGFTPLANAARHEQLAVIKLLVQAGADVNLCNNFGWSPLAEAVIFNRREVIDLLNKATSQKRILSIASAADERLGGQSPVHQFAHNPGLLRLLASLALNATEHEK